MENTIRFEQAVKAVNEKDKVQDYTEKVQLVVTTFAKNTLLQFMFFDIYGDCLELGEYLRAGDISNLLFDKLDEVFARFEDMQNDEKVLKLKDSITETIKSYNERLDRETH